MRALRYCPQLNTLTGSITASLLMCQLEYWFKKTGAKPFYKFLSPCEDMHYHTGDSWTEELGFTKAEFRTAFHKIGTVYKTKKAYKESTDPFEGKMYLSYYDRIRKLTYYLRNDALVHQLLANQDCEDGYSQDYLSPQIKPHKSSSLDMTPLSPNATHVASASVSSIIPMPTPKSALTSASSSASLPTSTLSPTSTPTPATPTPYARIVELFNTFCPSLKPVTSLSTSCKLKLDSLYQKLIAKGEEALSCLKKTFTLAEESDFLCGRTPHKSWKAVFGWIIRMDKFFAIQDGNYAAHSPTYKPPVAPQKFLRMYTHGFNIKELEAMEQAYLESRYGML